MKNSIKLLIIMILIVAGIIMTIIAFAMSTTVNKDAILAKNKEKILADYTELTNISSTNTELRNELNTKLTTFTNENYPQEHEEYVELLSKYNENINSITSYIDDMDARCEKKIEDARINVICKSYKILYEDIVNRYINNMNQYNNNIKIYNKIANTLYNEFEMLKKEYIDYDNDKNYLGKPD